MIGDAVAALGSNVIALGLIVAALWGASDFFGGLAARKTSTLLVVIVAHGLSMAVLVSIALTTHARTPTTHTVIWGLITGLSGGLALIAFYRALASGEMGLTAAIAGLLTALVPVVFSWITEGRPKGTQIFGFAIAAIALYLIAYEPRGTPHLRGLWLAGIAGLGFGIFLVASKFAAQGALLWPLAISRMASAALAGLMLLFSGVCNRFRKPERAGERLASASIREILLLAGVAGLLEVSGNFLYMVATMAGRLDVVAVLSSLYPAGTIMLAVLLLKERATRSKAFGMVLALASVVMISL